MTDHGPVLMRPSRDDHGDADDRALIALAVALRRTPPRCASNMILVHTPSAFDKALDRMQQFEYFAIPAWSNLPEPEPERIRPTPTPNRAQRRRPTAREQFYTSRHYTPGAP